MFRNLFSALRYGILVLWYQGPQHSAHRVNNNYGNIEGKVTKIVFSWSHTKRIYKKEKAKVVAASWGTEFLQFLAITLETTNI